MVVLAIEHGKIAPAAALVFFFLVALFLDSARKVGGLDFFISPGNNFDQRRRRGLPFPLRLLVSHRFKGRSLVGNRNPVLRERLSEHRRVLIHNAKSATEDRRERAPVLSEHNDSCGGKVLHKQRERFARSAAELVDPLIRIAHGKNVRRRTGEQRQDLDLGKIRVLEFIHQQEAGAPPFLFEHRGIVLHQLVGLGDHVAEGAQVFFQEHVFNGGENASNLLAALQDLRLFQLPLLLRARNTGKRDLAAFQALNVERVLCRSDQFVLATTHEIEQAIEELADVGSTDKVFKAQIANTAPQVHPEILVVEHAKTSAATLKQSIAPGMKGAGLQAVEGGPLQFRSHAGHHFRGGIVGIGERNNFVRAGVTFADEIGHALREDGGLPGAGAGDHQHRAINVSDGLLLAFIGNDLRRR